MNRKQLTCLIAALFMLLDLACVAAAEQDHRDALQELVSGDRALDGVRIDRAYVGQDCIFHIDSIFANPTQADRLKLIAVDYAKRNKLFPEAEPPTADHVKLGEFKFVPTVEFREELQAELSGNPELRGVRLDRAYFGPERHLELSGVFWPTLALAKQVDVKNAESHILDRLVITAMEFIIRDNARWIEMTRGGRVVVDGMEFFPSERAPPRLTRVLVAEDSQLDGIYIDDVYYGPKGHLSISGTASNPQQKVLLLAQINAQKANDANWKAWIGRHSSPDFHVRKFIPNEQTIGELEQSIAGIIRSTLPLTYNPTVHELTDKVLIERLYYTANDELAITGWRWNEVPNGKRPKTIGLGVLNDIVKGAQSNDPNLKGEDVDLQHLPLFNMAELKFRSPLMAVWDLIPQLKELDGIRIDRAYYKKGVLTFTGVQAKEGQINKLKDALPVASPLWQTLAAKGVAFDSFPIIATDTLKRDIQNQYAFHSGAFTPELDGTRINRIYYDVDQNADGDQGFIQPIFAIDLWFTGSAKGAVDPQGLAAKTISDQLTNNPLAWKRIREFGGAKFIIANERENPLPQLRRQIADNASMDGTRLDRAFYNSAGELHFSGMIGSESQLDIFDLLVKQTLGTNQARFGDYTPRGFVIGKDHFQLIDNSRVIACIDDLLPGYQKLDGARITRIYFEPQKNTPGVLTVDGRKADTNQTAEIANILGQWLNQSFRGRELLQYNTNNKVQTNRFELVKVRHDPFEAMSLLSASWQLFFCGQFNSAVQKLDLAILYAPENTQLWILRSLCYVGLDKIEYARRDARRAVLSMNPYRPQHRFKTLSRVQGPLRLCFEDVWQQAMIANPSGRMPFSQPSF